MNAKPAAHKRATAQAKNPGRKEPESPLQALNLPEGLSIALLKELHILTREGRLNQDSRRKLKQVLHLVRFIEPLVLECARQSSSEDPKEDFSQRPLVVDHGAGKSYLGFILADMVLRPLGRGRVVGVEFRPELVEKSRQLAARLGFGNMEFLALAVQDSAKDQSLPPQIDIVTALHACDTATDDAIAFGLQKRAKAMALVPCCQAEVAACLRATKAFNLARTPLSELWRHPLHTRELGSHLTNVLRCLYLEANGYQVTVTELIGWEHSMKNELILARYTGHRKRSAADRLQAILTEMGLEQALAHRFPLLAG